MDLGDPTATAIAYLILRHLYDGDVIEWPMPDEHPQRNVFAALEAQGLVARWDRIWPLSDRYRLTEKGIALIESVYRPTGSEEVFAELRRQNLHPKDRRGFMSSRRLDPLLWPLLHDPSTHWSTYATMGSRYQTYLWEDHRPQKRKRPPASPPKPSPVRSGGPARVVVVHHHAHHHDRHHPHHLVDLDREAGATGHAPSGPDYDVS